MKITFIVWACYHRRSELLAQHLGANIFYISYGQKGRKLHTLLKYPVQAIKTWPILRRELPDVILVQNPPIFCAFLVFFYARLYSAQYVIDSHTGAFISPGWRWFLGLHRWLSRRALVTIVHNADQEKIVKSWGCRYCVIGFTPGDYSKEERFSVDGKFNIAVISDFGPDDPLAEIFDAAISLPEVHFYVTGDSKRIPKPLLMRKPPNCHLTGYLSYSQYVGLLRGADAVMDLVNRNHTLLMGGFEAVSLGKPLITSDWLILRDYFSKGTVHIQNTAEGICEGVRRVQRDLAQLQRDIILLREHLELEWEQESTGLLRLMNNFEAN
jgi:glycosyltransferase involved in cell wall biosynthesis